MVKESYRFLWSAWNRSCILSGRPLSDSGWSSSTSLCFLLWIWWLGCYLFISAKATIATSCHLEINNNRGWLVPLRKRKDVLATPASRVCVPELGTAIGIHHIKAVPNEGAWYSCGCHMYFQRRWALIYHQLMDTSIKVLSKVWHSNNPA